MESAPFSVLESGTKFTQVHTPKNSNLATSICTLTSTGFDALTMLKLDSKLAWVQASKVLTLPGAIPLPQCRILVDIAVLC